MLERFVDPNLDPTICLGHPKDHFGAILVPSLEQIKTRRLATPAMIAPQLLKVGGCPRQRLQVA